VLITALVDCSATLAPDPGCCRDAVVTAALLELLAGPLLAGLPVLPPPPPPPQAAITSMAAKAAMAKLLVHDTAPGPCMIAAC